MYTVETTRFDGRTFSVETKTMQGAIRIMDEEVEWESTKEVSILNSNGVVLDSDYGQFHSFYS